MNTAVTPPNQLPETFDLKDLEGVFTDEELKALSEGDDPVVVLPDPAKPYPDAGDTLAAADAAALAAAQPPVAEPVQEPAKVQEPVIEVPDTKDAEAVVAGFDAKLEDIQTKYDGGDLTAAEMKAALKALNAEQAQAMATISRAEEAIVAQNTARETAWLNQLNAFKAAGNEALWSADHINGFDASLKRVTDTRIHPEMAGKPFDVLISTAATLYAAQQKALTGVDIPLGKAATTTPQPRTVPNEPRPDAPVLLGGLNGDGGMAVDDGSFAAVDRITDPFEMEAKMAAMSPEAYEQYLRTAS
jgi:hypothetical protein